MKKQSIFILSIVIISILVAFYVVKEYGQYKSYKSAEYREYRNLLGTALHIIYQDRPNRPSSIDDFIADVEKYISENQAEYLMSLLNKLKFERNEYRVKFIADSNTMIVYQIGFDGIDSGLAADIIEFEEMSFGKYFSKPKGDIIIAWAKLLDACEVPNLTYRFFYNGFSVSDQEIETIMFDQINPAMHRFISSALPIPAYIFLLYAFYAENDSNLWKGSLLCDWSETDD